jgi:hypothetical protein
MLAFAFIGASAASASFRPHPNAIDRLIAFIKDARSEPLVVEVIAPRRPVRAASWRPNRRIA